MLVLLVYGKQNVEDLKALPVCTTTDIRVVRQFMNRADRRHSHVLIVHEALRTILDRLRVDIIDAGNHLGWVDTTTMHKNLTTNLVGNLFGQR